MVKGSRFRGLRFRVWGLEFRVERSRVKGSMFGGLEFRGLGFGVWGLGSRD